MILPAICFVLRIPIWTFASTTKTASAPSFHLFHLSLIGFVNSCLNPSHQKAFTCSFWRCLIFSALGVISWHFFVNWTHSRATPPRKGMLCFWILLFCSEIKHLYHEQSEIYPANLLVLRWNWCGKVLIHAVIFSIYPSSFKSTKTRGQ